MSHLQEITHEHMCLGSFERRRPDPVVPSHTCKDDGWSPPQTRSYVCRSKTTRAPMSAADDDDIWVDRLVKAMQMVGLGELHKPVGGNEAAKSVEALTPNTLAGQRKQNKPKKQEIITTIVL